MRIAEYKQIDVDNVEKVIHHEASIDEKGKEIPAYDETIIVEKPIYGMVYRNMTTEEIAEQEAMAQKQVEAPPSAEERIEILEQAFVEFVEEVLSND